MLQLYKALAAVIVVTTITFFLARPLLRRFMSDTDFSHRRNIWLALNLAAFTIPNYWAYVLVASVVLAYGVKRDSNPPALYAFLLLAMVPVGLYLPTLGLVKQLFLVDHLRLLSLLVLLPTAVRLAGATTAPAVRAPYPRAADRLRLQADLLLALYAGLQIIVLMPHESVTATLRRSVLLIIDLWLPYYVFSRGMRSREQIVETMAAFALAMFVLAPLAVLESFKGWLLYAGLQEKWDTEPLINYLSRGSMLRAQLTAGHSIVLGYAMTIAFGFWLSLQGRVESLGWRVLAMLTLFIGIVMPLARGPWLGACFVLVMFLAVGPNRGSRILTVFGLLFLTGVAVVLSPWGSQVVDRLPFIGTLDEDTVSYRQQLAAMSWTLIRQNPWFGTPGFFAYLEDLRQGQGIIDLVNAYAGIALAYGLVALAALLGFFVLIVARCIGCVRASARADPGLASTGASIAACLMGTLLMIATVNLYLSVANITWMLAGLGVAYAGIVRRRGDAAGWPAASARGGAAWSAQGLASPAPHDE